jgi:hypothetical protein
VRPTNVDASVYISICSKGAPRLRQASRLKTKANSPRHLPNGLIKLSTAVKIHAVANPAINTMPIDIFYSLNTTLSMSKACPETEVVGLKVILRMAYAAPVIELTGNEFPM